MYVCIFYIYIYVGMKLILKFIYHASAVQKPDTYLYMKYLMYDNLIMCMRKFMIYIYLAFT